ncbi:MAG: hypothetical protein RIC57_08320 [Balneola sp.]
MSNSKKYWYLIAVQTGISLLAFTFLEILGDSIYVYLSLGFLIITPGIYAAIHAYKIQTKAFKKYFFLIGTFALTATNLIVVGLFIGQLVAILLGVWNFPPQD